MRDRAYRRDLIRALSQVVRVREVLVKKGHLFVYVELPDGRIKELTVGSSPRSHEHAIAHTVRDARKLLR